MITTAIIEFSTGLIYAIFYLLPDGQPFAPAFHESAIYFGGLLGKWNLIFPITDLIIILSFCVLVLLSYWLAKLTATIYAMFRGNSSALK